MKKDIKDLFKQLEKGPGLFIPEKMLYQFSGYCFDPQHFDRVCSLISESLLFKEKNNEIHRAIRTSIIIEYLVIKGASAWIDELPSFTMQLQQFLKKAEYGKDQSKLDILKEKFAKLRALTDDKAALMDLRYKAAELQAKLIEKGKQRPRLPEEQLAAQRSRGQKVAESLWEGVIKIDQGMERLDNWIDRQLDKLIGLPPDPRRMQSGIISELQI